jgi:hypothetical protein
MTMCGDPHFRHRRETVVISWVTTWILVCSTRQSPLSYGNNLPEIDREKTRDFLLLFSRSNIEEKLPLLEAIRSSQ